MAIVNASIQHLTDTAANFSSINPILLEGQFGVESNDLLTTPKYKIGDGVTAWNSLPYAISGGLQTLSQTLANGNNTGNTPITSVDGFSIIRMVNNQFRLSRAGSIQDSVIYINEGDITLEHNGSTIYGSLVVDNNSITAYHDVEINLDAPSSKKNGLEIATIDDIANAISALPPSNSFNLIRQEFTYTSGAQNFTLTQTPTTIYSVFVNGQELKSSQYSSAINVLNISDTLVSGDFVSIVYSDTSPTISGYVFNEVPNGLINGANATYTSLFNFVPSTVQLYLNGSLQKIIDDYNTLGSNTIILNTSPTAGENLLINYQKS